MNFLAFLLLLFGGIHQNVSPFTKGALCTTQDPDFKELRYPEQIPYCKRHVTRKTITIVAKKYGVVPSDYKYYEFDHLIPVALGGSNQPQNIWPQLLSEAKQKDVLEVRLYYAMRAGRVTQQEAIRQILTWKLETK